MELATHILPLPSIVCVIMKCLLDEWWSENISLNGVSLRVDGWNSIADVMASKCGIRRQKPQHLCSSIVIWKICVSLSLSFGFHEHWTSGKAVAVNKTHKIDDEKCARNCLDVSTAFGRFSNDQLLLLIYFLCHTQLRDKVKSGAEKDEYAIRNHTIFFFDNYN